MGEVECLSEFPEKPIYLQDAPSEPIEFGQIDVAFEHKDVQYKKTAKAVLKFLPSDQLSFVIPDDGISFFEAFGFAFDNWNGDVELAQSGVRIKAMFGAIGKEYGGVNLLPLTSGVQTMETSDKVVSATFHLFNFPNFRGPNDFLLKDGDSGEPSSGPYGRTVLKADGWIVTISALKDTSQETKALKAQGGYIITHVGRIERENGSCFTTDQLNELLVCVQYFLSFAIGRWAGLSLPVGIDRDGNRVFEEWGLRKAASGPWNASCSWFDEQHGELLTQVFPGFHKLWQSSVWNAALSGVIYWYCQANDRGSQIGVDTGLILAQTALELLAWNYCVIDKRIVLNAFGRRGLDLPPSNESTT